MHVGLRTFSDDRCTVVINLFTKSQPSSLVFLVLFLYMHRATSCLRSLHMCTGSYRLFANQASATAEQHWKRRVYNKNPFFLPFRWNIVPYNTESFQDSLWKGLISVFAMSHWFIVLYLEHRQSTQMITFCFTGIMRQHSGSVDNTITLKQEGLYASF